MSRLSRTGLDAIPLTAISASDGSNTNSTHLRQAHSDSQHDNINIVGEISAALPPVDKGRQAWTFLAAAFVVEGLCWGMPQSYGLFQEYLTVHTDFGSSGVSIVGTLSSGIIYMSAPILFPLVTRYPRQRALSLWIGLAMTVLGFILASFATKLWHLILAHGVLCSIGSAFLYAPAQILLNEWFQERRGLAMGIMFSGTGLAGTFLPIVVGWMLEVHGWRTTYRVWAATLAVLTAPAIPALKGRIPIPAKTIIRPVPRGRRPSIYLRLCHSPTFLFLALANLLQALAHFVPPLYLPTFAYDLGDMSSISKTILVSVINGSSVFGRLGLGYLSDKVDLAVPAIISPLVAGISVLVGWGFSRHIPELAMFAAVFGAFSGGWSVLWSRFGSRIVAERTIVEDGEISQQAPGLWQKSEESDVIAVIYGILSLGRGLGNIVTGPITAALLAKTSKVQIHDYGLDKYESMIVLTGVSMVLCALVALTGRYWTRFMVAIHKRLDSFKLKVYSCLTTRV